MRVWANDAIIMTRDASILLFPLTNGTLVHSITLELGFSEFMALYAAINARLFLEFDAGKSEEPRQPLVSNPNMAAVFINVD